MIANFKAISLSYKNAPLEIRELMSLDELLCKKMMLELKDLPVISDILALSTCNRTEIYYCSDIDYTKEIIFLLGAQKGIFSMDDYYVYFDSIYHHHQAIQHLFEVCIGLDSQVIGDAQISNQVKNAYQRSADLSMAGPFLHRLMHTIFATHKKVASTTSFREGVASVSYATVELVESLCTGLSDPKILIVGLGEIGMDVCRYMTKAAFSNITIVNRTLSKAEEFTKKSSVKILPFDQLWQAIGEADIVISSVRMPEPIITRKKVDQLQIHSHKYFIDISVPRSIEATIEENPGIIVYNIDQIQIKTTQALTKRREAIPTVKKIISESITEVENWSKEMEVSPLIHKFKETLEQIRKQELSRYVKTLNENESHTIQLITKSMVQKIIKLPVLQLKAARKRGESEHLIRVLNELFDI